MPQLDGSTTTQQPRNIFGERTWDDVRTVITGRVRRSFQRVSAHQLEDAVATALVDLIDYWIHLPSSIRENKEQTFWLACRRGEWMAKQFLATELGDCTITQVGYPEDAYGEVVGAIVGGASESDTEDIAQERALARLLEDAPDEEFELWLNDFMSGCSLAEAGNRLGVSYQAIQRRRVWGMSRLRHRASELGLAVGA